MAVGRSWFWMMADIIYDSFGDPLRNLDRDRVAERSVAGRVQPFGKPCKVSYSVGVNLRTDIVSGARFIDGVPAICLE